MCPIEISCSDQLAPNRISELLSDSRTVIRSISLANHSTMSLSKGLVSIFLGSIFLNPTNDFPNLAGRSLGYSSPIPTAKPCWTLKLLHLSNSEDHGSVEYPRVRSWQVLLPRCFPDLSLEQGWPIVNWLHPDLDMIPNSVIPADHGDAGSRIVSR